MQLWRFDSDIVTTFDGRVFLKFDFFAMQLVLKEVNVLLVDN